MHGYLHAAHAAASHAAASAPLLIPYHRQLTPQFNDGEAITREYYNGWMSGNSNPAIGERPLASIADPCAFPRCKSGCSDMMSIN